MDAKFTKRFEDYKKSLASLSEARLRDLSDSFILSGTGAKFSITFDLAWKVMKDVLIQRYDINNFIAGSPREVIRTAFSANLIDDDEWLEMLKVRNELAHDYDGSIILFNCQNIITRYIDRMMDFQLRVEQVIREC
jgi:nucleotidyltransferase substrate binding protein (TIGR01987 family)